MRNPFTAMATIGSLVILIIAVLFLDAPSMGQEPSMEERMTLLEQKVALEERLSILEKKVASLEEKIAELIQESSRLSGEVSPELSPDIASKGDWRASENWRTHLKFGMTEDQVRELMGKPDKIEKMMLIGRVWYYGGVGGSSVNFGTNARVKSWLEPPPDQLK